MEDEKNDAFDDLLNTPEAFTEEKILDYDVGTDNAEISTEADLDSSIHALEGKVSDDYLEADLEIEEDFLDTKELKKHYIHFINHMEKTFDEEKILDTTSTTSFLSTTISSLDKAGLNENLTKSANRKF